MSYMAFHADADRSLAGKFWGTKVRDDNGVLKDTGVQELVETLLQILSSVGPIELHRPLEFINRTNGPAMKIYNTGDDDWHGIRVHDNRGNESQLGIGLGNENLLANEFIPHPDASIDPFDQQRFYSDLGGNAGRDRDHPQAVFANNGLYGPNIFAPYQPPFWNWHTPPQFVNDACHPHHLWDFTFGHQAVLPHYVPQAASDVTVKFFLGRATQNHLLESKIDYIREETTGACSTQDVAPEETIADVCNLFFGCIEQGDTCLIAVPVCQETVIGDPIVAQAPTKRHFAQGTTDEAITLGGAGDVDIGEATPITASSPFCAIPAGTDVAISRDTGAGCGSWVIIAAACP